MMTLKQMKEALENGLTTSENLVRESLRMHQVWKDKNAIASIHPDVLKLALERDKERAKGLIRGSLHGLPIVIKDNILLNDQTPTTCNSYAFHDFFAPYQASIVNMLEKEGAIIFGKANLSEFAYFMSYDNMPSGYGSMHGQVKHPFDETIDPYGSSTGSAVAVKLGIVSGAIGTETNGSLMAPAYQCQIVSYKPTFGMVSKYGIIPISPTQDTAGPMASTVYDCAMLMDAINQKDEHDQDTLPIKRDKKFVDMLDKPLRKGKIGLLTLTNHPYSEEDMKVYQQSFERLKSMGHEVIEISIEHPKLNNDPTLIIEFKHSMNAFLDTVKGATKHRTLSDIIKFNSQNAERCLKYGQSILEASDKTNGNLKSETYLELRSNLVKEASRLENLILEHNLLAIVAPVWMGFAPIYGNPSICIPEGIFNKIPKASVFVGAKFDDHRLMQLCHHYEQKKNENL